MPRGSGPLHELTAGLDYPMLIVTVRAGGERSGCLVGFATQCSIDPPRFLVCISDANHTAAVAAAADSMVVHVVPADGMDLARLFGEETGDEIDKLDRCEWVPGPDGTPVLTRCRNWFRGRILDAFHAGDHRAYLVEPEETRSDPGQGFLSFQQVRDMEPGHPA
jgi:flavin reductase (DIM6/NTAB) family NADH-FMN oxidoreductase RutF